MLRVLVCGGRDYDERAHVFAVLDALHAEHGISTIIHGACGVDATDRDARRLKGADGLANEWAITRGVAVFSIPAAWRTQGVSAGPIRNARLLAEGRPDLVVAFPGDRGTRDMMTRARNAGVRVQLARL